MVKNVSSQETRSSTCQHLMGGGGCYSRTFGLLVIFNIYLRLGSLQHNEHGKMKEVRADTRVHVISLVY